jgi:succinate-semialdehyde dehydrogenase/glutarate-semialdehyde dehydrogenase
VLVESADVDAISFTGSTEVGLSIAALAAKTLKHISLELGGNDPFIVCEDADMELALAEAVGGRLSNAGQTCCAPKRFIVHHSLVDSFTSGLVERHKKVKTGCPLSQDTELGSMINEAAALRVEEQIAKTVAQGAKLLLGGKKLEHAYFEPTVLAGVTTDMDIARDMEVFGPVWPVISYSTLDEAIEIANNTRYGLHAGVISKDFGKAMHVAGRLECGGVVINGSGCYRNVDQPFGGVKMSGVGREGMCCALQSMSREKSYILKSALAYGSH